MASEFQKDLYKKKGSSFTIWDACIAIGIASIGSGVYCHYKDNSTKSKSVPEKKQIPEKIPSKPMGKPMGKSMEKPLTVEKPESDTISKKLGL
jgi:hypothetical protein